MSENKYKLVYFNFKSRAEPIRLIFALADVPYEDFRFEKSTWNIEMKNDTPWGQVPYLEINGKRLAQSSAICRYLARKFNLAGADEFEAAKCDELIDAIMDLRAEWKPFFTESDKDKREALRKTLIEVSFPKYFKKFDKIAEDNKGEGLVGKKITWADLHITATLEFFKDTVPGVSFDDYPNLQALMVRVFEIPKIKAWIEKRPKTTR